MPDLNYFSVRAVGPVQPAPLTLKTGHGFTGLFLSTGMTGTGQARKEGNQDLWLGSKPGIGYRIRLGTLLQEVKIEGGYYTFGYPRTKAYEAFTGEGDLYFGKHNQSTNNPPHLANGFIVDHENPYGYTFFPYGQPADQNLRNRSILRCRAKLAGAEVSGSVDLVESPETLAMLRLAKIAKMARSPIRELTKLAKDLGKEAKRYRRGSNLRKALKPADALSSVWLEYRMGWKPAVAAFESYRDLLLKGFAELEGVHRVRATEKVEWNTVLTDVTVSIQPERRIDGRYYIYTYRRGGVLVGYDKYSTTIYYKTHALSKYHQMRVKLGLTAGDLPMHIWETIPLSFVVDRFLDVGTWLAAKQVNPGVTKLAEFITVKREVEHTPIISRWSEYYTLKTVKVPRLTCKTMHRQPIGTEPIFPTVNRELLDLVQKTDHLALAIQRCMKPLSALGRKRS